MAVKLTDIVVEVHLGVPNAPQTFVLVRNLMKVEGRTHLGLHGRESKKTVSAVRHGQSNGHLHCGEKEASQLVEACQVGTDVETTRLTVPSKEGSVSAIAEQE